MTQALGPQAKSIFTWHRLSTPLGAKILSFVQQSDTGYTCSYFKVFQRQMMFQLWRDAGKNGDLAELQVDVLFYNPTLKVSIQTVSECFSKLLERQRAYCPSYQKEFDQERQRHLGKLSLDRFVQGQRYVNQERDENLVKLWVVIKAKIERLAKEHGTYKMQQDAANLEGAAAIREWMSNPENQSALLNKITQLDLSQNDLTEVPREILLLKGLEAEKLSIERNPLYRISPELTPYIALNMPGLCDAEDKKAPLRRLNDLQEVPFRLWFRQNCMPGAVYQKIVETIGECVLKVLGAVLVIPGAIFYFFTTALPAFLLNHFAMYLIEPVMAWGRSVLGYPPTVEIKK